MPNEDESMTRLLDDDEPPAVQMVRRAGRSAFFLTCDHAGNRLPRALGTLGLPEFERQRHIAWDIGAAGLALRLAEALDAPLVLQPYSRLVIDCNRPPDASSSIASLSELTVIPGNRQVTPAAAEARRREIFQPYHDRIASELDARQGLGRATIMITIHSFTPEFKGEARPWHVGVLYNRDTRLARILLGLLRAEPGLVVGDNQPYSVNDETDYTIPVHAERRGLPHAELEIRQDLIVDESGQMAWAARLAGVFRRAEDQLNRPL